MGKICRVYAYSTAEESRKPGYLKAKFDKIRRELREKEAAQATRPRATVRVLKGKGA